MNSPTEEIKARLDIVEFVNSYVRLTKAGINYKAACPFHSEKTPSFFVSPSRQLWHCFGGCGEGGDIFKFVMKIEGLDFPEALRLLAARAGVVLKREDPRVRSERNRLYDICEAAAEIFERSLLLTAEPKEYLRSRGMNEETVRSFRIGWAPQSWDFMLKTLAQKGFKPDEVEKAGLAVRSEDGNSRYDRFRSRVIFPITDANGRIIGFGGRIFNVGDARTVKTVQNISNVSNDSNDLNRRTEAKYINTPQTLIYDKSRALYGFDKAKQEIRAKNQVVITEGYMDCVMSHQAGVKNTIAVSGTALTPSQLSVLRRLCDTLVSSFDADAAGDSATKRSLALAAQFEFGRRIALIPSGKDPADMVRGNPEAWRQAVEGARPVIEFYFEKMFRTENPETVEGKRRISQTLLPLMAELADEIEKAHWVSRLSARLVVGEEAVWKELKKRPAAPMGAPIREEEKPSVPSRRDLLEDRFLTVLAFVPDELKKRELGEHRISFASALNGELFGFLLGGADAAAAPARAEAVRLAPHIEALRFKGEVLREIVPDLESEFILCRRELEKVCVKERLLALGEEIERIEREGGHTAAAPLLEDFRSLSEELRVLS